MKIRVCDICGSELDDDKVLSKRFKVKIKMIYASVGGCLKTKKYDICRACMNKIVNNIDEATDETEGDEWIPVSERLPESAGVYIVTREFTDGFECADLTDACYFDGTSTWHNDNRINHGRAYVDKEIKAWMPLPEPYKAESEGEK